MATISISTSNPAVTQSNSETNIVYVGVDNNELDITFTNNTGNAISTQPGWAITVYLPQAQVGFSKQQIGNMAVINPPAGWACSASSATGALTFTPAGGTLWADNAAITFKVTQMALSGTTGSGNIYVLFPDFIPAITTGGNLQLNFFENSQNTQPDLSDHVSISLLNGGPVYVSQTEPTLTAPISNTLTLVIANTSSTNALGVYGSGNPQINVSFEYGDNNTSLAPGDDNQQDGATNITGIPVNDNENPWLRDGKSTGTLLWTFVPEDTNTGLINAGESVFIQFSNVVSYNPSGAAASVFISLSGFYQDAGTPYNSCSTALSIPLNEIITAQNFGISNISNPITPYIDDNGIFNVPLQWAMVGIGSVSVSLNSDGSDPIWTSPGGGYARSVTEVWVAPDQGSLTTTPVGSCTVQIPGITQSIQPTLYLTGYGTSDPSADPITYGSITVELVVPVLIEEFYATINADGSFSVTYTTSGSTQSNLESCSWSAYPPLAYPQQTLPLGNFWNFKNGASYISPTSPLAITALDIDPQTGIHYTATARLNWVVAAGASGTYNACNDQASVLSMCVAGPSAICLLVSDWTNFNQSCINAPISGQNPVTVFTTAEWYTQNYTSASMTQSIYAVLQGECIYSAISSSQVFPVSPIEPYIAFGNYNDTLATFSQYQVPPALADPGGASGEGNLSYTFLATPGSGSNAISLIAIYNPADNNGQLEIRETKIVAFDPDGTPQPPAQPTAIYNTLGSYTITPLVCGWFDIDPPQVQITNNPVLYTNDGASLLIACSSANFIFSGAGNYCFANVVPGATGISGFAVSGNYKDVSFPGADLYNIFTFAISALYTAAPACPSFNVIMAGTDYAPVSIPLADIPLLFPATNANGGTSVQMQSIQQIAVSPDGNILAVFALGNVVGGYVFIYIYNAITLTLLYSGDASFTCGNYGFQAAITCSGNGVYNIVMAQAAFQQTLTFTFGPVPADQN